MILQAENITFRYAQANRLILNRFDFTMTSKETVGLVAPSGFGKTTLCKILSGYEQPQSGRVLLNGHSLPHYGAYCPVQMIWQHPEQAINPRLPMKKVLAEGQGLEPDLAAALGIHPQWLTRFAGELSGGELQRFCIARALGSGTKMLLADEITTMLDLITQAQIWQVITAECRRREIGLLVVSHSKPLLSRVCTRKINLNTIS